MTTPEIVAASFRDPSGFLFVQQATLYRQVNQSYRQDYDLLMGSGLYDALLNAGLLVPHSEADLTLARSDSAYRVLEPEPVPYISYPYEWCFSQLKDAALTTLRIQQIAMQHDMCLKDASAYNIQFLQGRPVLIDTLSFERYREGEPWIAYRQFCQHFLAPLALMSYLDADLIKLLRVHIDGIPLPLTSKLLPRRSRLRLSLLIHLHLHARTQKRFEGKTVNSRKSAVSRIGLQGLLSNLESAVRKLDWHPSGTEWGEYYSDTNYSDAAMERKKDLVARYLEQISSSTVWVHDLGANTGVFSRVARNKGMLVISQDVDPAAVEKNYRQCRDDGETKLLPLVQDLTNPSPAIGWAHRERMSLLERGPADAVLALALIHHLAISNNVPLQQIAAFFHAAGKHLIIEFVPKSDSQVQRLLASREDIFPGYTEEGFEAAFRNHFDILESTAIPDTERTLYLMARR